MTDGKNQHRLNAELTAFAIAGDLERAKAAVALGADITHDFHLPLRRAAREGRDDVVAWLVSAGADIKALSGDPLRAAVKAGKASTVSLLLKLGADPNAHDGDPVILAAERGDAGILRDLLAHKADVHAAEDLALRKAAFGGHGDAVRVLLGFGADVFSMRGAAAALAGNRHQDVMQILAEKMNEERQAFLFDLALQDSSLGFLRIPYAGTGEPALIRALKMNCLDAVIEKMRQSKDTVSGATLAMTDRTGRSVAALAAEYGQLKKLFHPDLVQGMTDQLLEAWQKLPETLQKQSGVGADEFQSIIAAERQRAMKAAMPRFTLKRGPAPSP